ncbi:MAG: hypothetical protein M1387_06695 [Thaumarchaeota archaeon]|nr:hypothetical protein [Nitrososphaerota archaeon]
MVKKGWTQVILKDELACTLLARLEEVYKNKPRKPELSTFIQDILWEVIESEEILRRYGPFLSKFAVEPGKVFLRDNRKDTLVELDFRDGELFCQEDERFDCVHVGFAWALPEVYKALNLYGKKKPNIKD